MKGLEEGRSTRPTSTHDSAVGVWTQDVVDGAHSRWTLLIVTGNLRLSPPVYPGVEFDLK